MSTQLTEHDIKRNTGLLIQASAQGNINEVIRLIPISNPTEYEDAALLGAVFYKQVKCVKLLLPVSDPKSYSLALINAAGYGYTEIFELLLPLSDPKTMQSRALEWAVEEKQTDIIRQLIPVSDYQLVLTRQQNNGENVEFLQQFIDEYEAVSQQHRLHENLNEIIENKPQSIKRKM